MGRILFAGFRGTRNASGILAEQMSGDCCLLTNSFSGLERDVEAIDRNAFDDVIMFGVDSELAGTVRLERVADKDGVRYASSLDLEAIAESIRATGLGAMISVNPTSWLCNDAYWHMLRKFDGRAVFLHIPTIRNMDEAFFRGIRQAILSVFG